MKLTCLTNPADGALETRYLTEYYPPAKIGSRWVLEIMNTRFGKQGIISFILRATLVVAGTLVFAIGSFGQETGGELGGGAGIFRPKNPEAKRSGGPPKPGRPRMVNLRLFPYVGSKLFVLALIVSLQCALLFAVFKFFHYTGLMSMPGWAVPQFFVMIIASLVGIGLGLFISAIVKTSEMATSLIPLILIPQIIFSGLVGVPQGTAKAVGAIMT